MNKHSPGPWSYDFGIMPPDGPNRYSQVTADGGNYIICEVNEWNEGHANGYLIAASPMLLEALKDARFALYGSGPGNPKIDAAIAAAEGDV